MKKLTALIIFTLISALPIGASSNRPCPELTDSEWQDVLSLFLNPSFTHPDGKILQDSGFSPTPNQLYRELRSCLPAKTENKECRPNWMKFFEYQEQIHKPGHSMEFILSDQEYLDQIPKGFVDLPEELKNGLPENYREIFKQKNWEFLNYRASFLPNPPNLSFSRLLLFISHDCFDQWFQISMPEGQIERLIDVIAVQTKDCKTKQPLLQNKIFFHEYWRNEFGEKPVNLANRATCYSCHMTGMNQLRPAPGSVPRNQLETMKSFNGRFENYNNLDWGNAIDMTAYGPPMGKSIGCTSCHNNLHDLEFRGSLNSYHLSDRSALRITHKMIDSLAMVPSTLARDPRAELFRDYSTRVYDLPDSALASLNTNSKIKTVLDMFSLHLTRHGGPVGVPISSIYEALAEAGKISPAELTSISENIASIQADQLKKYKKMTREYLSELIAWLKEDSPTCKPHQTVSW